MPVGEHSDSIVGVAIAAILPRLSIRGPFLRGA
jgi:hypothetical protein